MRCERLERRQLLTITVDTLLDEADGSIVDGDVSLRDAIAAATAGETIDFHASLEGGTILLTLGEVVITDAIALNATALTSGLTIDASGNDPTPNINDGNGSRVFNIDDGNITDLEVAMRGLTLTGGDVNGGGGAILTLENLTLTSSTISGNSAITRGGGIRAYGELTVTSSTISGNSAVEGTSYGGGIFADGTVTVTSSTISGNFARRGGGGISTSSDLTVTSSTISGNSGSLGGGINSLGASTVTSSTISGNSAVEGGGIYSHGDVTVIFSTISANSATSIGGGILAFSNATISSSTVSGNSAFRYGTYGFGIGGGISAYGNVTVTCSTISGNSARSGGGIRAGSAPVSVENSIVATNSATNTGPDLRLGANSLNVSFSLIGDNTGTALAEAPVGMPDVNGNLVGGPINGTINAMLAPLASNGGPTETHALLPGSPGINAGDPAFTPPPDFDQRGAPFVRVAEGRLDMGAFEVQTLGDMDFDGDLDLDDIDDFVLGLRNASAYEAMYGVPPGTNGDTDGDGDFDFDDIPEFVDRLLSGTEDILSVSTPATANVPDADITGFVDL